MSRPISRRDLLLRGAAGGGALWLFLNLPRPRTLAALEDDDAPPAVLREADWKMVEAITGRILPADDEPGAIEAGCVRFIDRALGNEEADARPVYEAGLAALHALCRSRFGRAFVDLAPERQDEVLESLARGRVDGWSAKETDPKRFFEIVRLHTILGFLSDPRYGGNRAYAGWRAAGYLAPRRRSGYTAKQLVGEAPIPPIWQIRPMRSVGRPEEA